MYLHYLRTMGYCEAEYALTRRRRLAIRSRLGEYDPEVLEAAIETCRASPWHMGQGPNSSPGGYHELDKHILKSRECVEVWLRRRRSQHGAQTVAR